MTSKREVFLIALIAFLLGVIACHTMSQQVKPAMAQPAPAAGQKFEQICEHFAKSIAFPNNDAMFAEYLNSMAQSEWKLVSVSLNAYEPYFCFVREL